jgi:predicted XRE-type DNA-binding protein
METVTTTHWTNETIDDFVHKIASDFVLQIENFLDSDGSTQDALAKKLNVTPGRVSQVLNKPGNLGLRKIVEYVRALNKKVAIVAYDDNDPANVNGPINSQVFERCWQRAGRPSDFFALQEAETIQMYVLMPKVPLPVAPTSMRANTSSQPFEMNKTDSTDSNKGVFNIQMYAGASNG